jgi:hypothetical protein
MFVLFRNDLQKKKKKNRKKTSQMKEARYTRIVINMVQPCPIVICRKRKKKKENLSKLKGVKNKIIIMVSSIMLELRIVSFETFHDVML